MPKLRRVSGQEAIRALERLGVDSQHILHNFSLRHLC